jgi:hypothetical protein
MLTSRAGYDQRKLIEGANTNQHFINALPHDPFRCHTSVIEADLHIRHLKPFSRSVHASGEIGRRLVITRPLWYVSILKSGPLETVDYELAEGTAIICGIFKVEEGRVVLVMQGSWRGWEHRTLAKILLH